MTFPGLLIFGPPKTPPTSPWDPSGVGWVIFLAQNECRIYPNMCAKFGCGPTVVSKKRGVQTDRQTEKIAALYSRLAGYPVSLGRKGVRKGGEGGRGVRGRMGGRE